MKRSLIAVLSVLMLLTMAPSPAAGQSQDGSVIINATVYNESGDSVASARFTDGTVYTRDPYGWEVNHAGVGSITSGYYDNLTVNGSVVDSFEDGDIAEYSEGSPAEFGVVTSPVAHGSNSLEVLPSDGSHFGIVRPEENATDGPSPGDNFTFQIRLSNSDTRQNFVWASNTSTMDNNGQSVDAYAVRISSRSVDQDLSVERRISGESDTRNGADFEGGLNTGEWYTVRVEWSEIAYNVSGYVKDEGGNTIDGATVTFDNGVSATTNSNGLYEVLLTNGTYSYEANAGPYQKNSDAGSVTVDGASVENVNATLKASGELIDLDVPGRMAHNETKPYELEVGKTALTVDVFNDSFEDEPADDGVPEDWTGSGSMSASVTSSVAYDGSQSVELTASADQAGYIIPDAQPYSSSTTDRVSVAMREDSSSGAANGDTQPEFIILEDGTELLTINLFQEELRVAGSTVTSVSTDSWAFVRVENWDIVANTVDVYWETGGNSGTVADVPLNTGTSGGYDETRLRVNAASYDSGVVQFDDYARSEVNVQEPSVTVSSNRTNLLTVDQSAGTLTSKDTSGLVGVIASTTINGTEVAVEETVIVAQINLQDLTLLPASYALVAIVTDLGFAAMLVGMLISAGLCRAAHGDEFVCVGASGVCVMAVWVIGFVGVYMAAVALLAVALLLFNSSNEV